MVRRHRVLVVVLGVVAALAACTRAPDVSAGSTADAADWAVRAWDPCTALMDAARTARLDASGAPFRPRPHDCVLDHRRADGRPGRVEVRVGAEVGSESRRGAAPLVLAGLAAYRERPVRSVGDAPESSVCRVHLPLDGYRVVRVQADDDGGGLATGCATAERVAFGVAMAMSRPVAAGAPDRVRGPMGRDACDLLDAAGTVSANRPDQATPTDGSGADACRGRRFLTLIGAVTLSLGTGPGGQETVTAENIGGSAFTDQDPPRCTIGVDIGPNPGAPPAHAVFRLTVSASESGDPCGPVRDVRDDVLGELQNEAPEPGPTPPRLGLAPAQEDVGPSACLGLNPAATCRRADRVGLPAEPTAVLAAVTEHEPDPATADRTCALVREAAEALLGPDVEVAAATYGRVTAHHNVCLVRGDSVRYELDVDPPTAGPRYACSPTTGRRDDFAPITLQGRAGCAETTSAERRLALPTRVGGTVADSEVLLQAVVEPFTVGDASVQPDPGAPLDPAVAALGDRLTEAALRRLG